jgi:glyoxylase-like metal-dependent hydrolase (beta-lactamase superfamily II)
MTIPHSPTLPPGMTVLERGWLSANNVIFSGPEGHALVDSGYCTHSAQTLALVASTLNDQPLQRLLNTHLHSDHCGGNAALQAQYPSLQTLVPPGEAAAVTTWDESALSYQRTGQNCPRFAITGVLQPGSEQVLGGLVWQVLAAPGHDPHAVLLFQPEHRTLISGDALWENGFGVVFPELEGESAFNEVGATLDLIESLAPRLVVPGHGAVFGGKTAVMEALARARQRLTRFTEAPHRHTQYGLKVLLKFKLLEWQSIGWDELLAWARTTPYLVDLHHRHATNQHFAEWTSDLVNELVAAGALERDSDGRLHDR